MLNFMQFCARNGNPVGATKILDVTAGSFLLAARMGGYDGGTPLGEQRLPGHHPKLADEYYVELSLADKGDPMWLLHHPKRSDVDDYYTVMSDARFQRLYTPAALPEPPALKAELLDANSSDNDIFHSHLAAALTIARGFDSREAGMVRVRLEEARMWFDAIPRTS